jgi:hypothetical protein
MSVDPIWVFFGGSTLVVVSIYAIHMLDERKWAREAKEREEWERTHPAE